MPLHQIPALSGWWNSSGQPRLDNLLYKHFGVFDHKSQFTTRDLFVVKYSTDGQRGLELHNDGSHFSFNILLTSTNSFEGGGTYFEGPDVTLSPEQGEALIH